jgi:phage terminase large subunit GpA-like protein
VGDLWATYSCPHCGETNQVPVDDGGPDDQAYVEDCQVCCKPNVLHIHVDREGQTATVWAASDN